ncbi:MAG: hypothetical protein LBC07_02950, partial [Elusimicrobiota bacterium]|nr:hypothetical protein [Elusimicrobiota bacterium]
MKKEVCIPSSLSFKNFYALLKSKIKISHFLITLPFLLLSFSFLPSKAFCAPSFEEQLEQTSKGISSIRTLTGNKKLAVMGFQDLVNLKGRSSNVSTIIEQDLSNLLINDM